jgi:hypothetical protein
MKGNMEYSEQNNAIHANVKWLKPQLQAAYAKWEAAKSIDEMQEAFNVWTKLFDEEWDTERQANQQAKNSAGKNFLEKLRAAPKELPPKTSQDTF